MFRSLLLCSLAFSFCLATRAAEPFAIKDGDRVLFLGDTLLEREGTYRLTSETRHQAEQFPDRHFIVRNLAYSADTPLGWSRASFDPVAKGFERLKEQIALVKPTVVFLGYGMAASLQEMTDRSGDPTLNPDPVRYGTEPMSATRFKGELAQLMDAINEISGGPGAVRYVLLSPIRHEDLRKFKPGLPDPTAHNKLLEQYTKAIEQLAQERAARFVNLFAFERGDDLFTENGIHPTAGGYSYLFNDIVASSLDWSASKPPPTDNAGIQADYQTWSQLNRAILRKNELFFNRWRPANSTYLFGFRKHQNRQNRQREIPEFDPLIEAADAKIDELKRAGTPDQTNAAPCRTPAPIPAVKDLAPVPPFPPPNSPSTKASRLSSGPRIPLLFKPTEMNCGIRKAAFGSPAARSIP